jgi:hypothetical protein
MLSGTFKDDLCAHVAMQCLSSLVPGECRAPKYSEFATTKSAHGGSQSLLNEQADLRFGQLVGCCINSVHQKRTTLLCRKGSNRHNNVERTTFETFFAFETPCFAVSVRYGSVHLVPKTKGFRQSRTAFF